MQDGGDKSITIIHGNIVHGNIIHGNMVHGNTVHGNIIHGNIVHGNTVHGNIIHGNTINWQYDISGIYLCDNSGILSSFSICDVSYVVNNSHIIIGNGYTITTFQGVGVDASNTSTSLILQLMQAALYKYDNEYHI